MGTQQPSKQKRSWKQRIYALANTTWTITSWIWTAIIIAFVVQFIPAYLFSGSSSIWEDVLKWFNNDALGVNFKIREGREFNAFCGPSLVSPVLVFCADELSYQRVWRGIGVLL